MHDSSRYILGILIVFLKNLKIRLFLLENKYAIKDLYIFLTNRKINKIRKNNLLKNQKKFQPKNVYKKYITLTNSAILIRNLFAFRRIFH